VYLSGTVFDQAPVEFHDERKLRLPHPQP
jgi:hypothetical protein